MVWFLVCAAMLWGIGHWTGTPVRARWLMIALLYVAALMALLLLPAGNPVQSMLGGTVQEWMVLGGLAAVVYAYSRVLALVRARVVAKEPVVAETADAQGFAPGELPRYARHIMLREIGGPGQKKLKQARVLVVGAGGLGSPACMYLAAAGVGTIGVIDDDVVEETNLQRQIAHADARIGMAKVFSAEKAMRALNPFVTVRPYHRRLDEEIAADLVVEYDLVLDGVDNFDTRYLVNRACVAAGVPLVSAALTQWEGQISVFDPARGAPCYQCIFPEAPAPELVPSCAEAGVLGPLPGVMGSMMAAEAVKVIACAGESLRGRLMIFDALYAETRVIAIKPRPDCPVCGA